MTRLSNPLSISRMKRGNKFLLLVIILLIVAYLAKGFFFSSQPARQDKGSLPSYLLIENWQAHVQEVVNPHTLTVLSPHGEKIIIRLYGVEGPPENNTSYRESVRLVAEMINQDQVIIIPFREDQRGRLIANVHSSVHGRNFSEELIRNGLAAVSRDYCRHEICMYWFGLEEDARRTNRGMWRNKGS
ncbi:thermonuclease family protein [Desulfonatronovibrio magnus]|uniref:thermonuclease family protein n=1 Tax=Desulfonatronovibrio magnus TaxID=698827 RepID=UPI0005EB6DAF|nr:thermonuclease family protein [Desulfonatronovibrio magnus]